MTEIILPTELPNECGIRGSSSPARKCIVDGEEVRIAYMDCMSIEDETTEATAFVPILNAFLARAASCSKPKGVTNGDLEFRVAAIVRAGSRHRKSAAIRRNLPI